MVRTCCLLSAILWTASPALAIRFKNQKEEFEWLEKRHVEQRQLIRRSVSENDTVDIIIMVNASCTSSLPHDFKRTNGRAATVHIDAYETMQARKNELCISMIELDPRVDFAYSVSAQKNGFSQVSSFEAFDQEYENWGVKEILGDSFPPAYSGGGTPVGICIIDSGAKINHADFPWESETDPGVEGNEFDVGNAVWYEAQSVSWHGTFVTGVICAERNNNMGISGINGECKKKVKLYIARVFGDVTGATAKMSTVDRALEWCVDKGARVINLSLASPVYSYNSHLIYQSVQDKDEVLIVAAAGNGGPDSPPSYPAYHAEVLSVGAVDKNMNVASFSQKFVDVVAPGVGVFSTAVNYGVGFETLNKGKVVVPLLFSALPKKPSKGPPCDCGCALSPCSCPRPSSICIINRCPSSEVSVTFQTSNAEAGGCAGVIVSSPDAVSLYANGPDFTFQAQIPVVFDENSDFQSQGIQSSLQVEDTLSIDFAKSDIRVEDGTSYAAPFVSGLVSLLLYERPGCSASQVRRAIENTATPVSGDSELTGKGFIQGEAAYRYLLSREPPPCGLDPSATQPGSGSTPVGTGATADGDPSVTQPGSGSTPVGTGATAEELDEIQGNPSSMDSLLEMLPGFEKKSSSSSTEKQKSTSASSYKNSGGRLRTRVRFS